MDFPNIITSLGIEDLIFIGVSLIIGVLISWLLSRPKINQRDEYISELEESIEEKDANLKGLKKNIKEQQTLQENLETQLKQEEETNKSMYEQLKEQKKYINTLEDEIADLNKQKQELTIRAEDAESRIGEHEIRLQEKEQEITTLKARARAMQDDFSHISGIGPKVSTVLRRAGIKSFEQLASTKLDKIRKILETENPNLLRLTDPSSWPKQAKMAAEGDWEALSALKDSLKKKPSSIVETIDEDTPPIITHAEPV